MGYDNTLDASFQQAVTAIDAGDLDTLQRLMAERPEIVRERLDEPGNWLGEQVGGALDGFFQRPYLLWFVAEDPVRRGSLPSNIAEIASSIIEAAHRAGVPDRRERDLARPCGARPGCDRAFGRRFGHGGIAAHGRR